MTFPTETAVVEYQQANPETMPLAMRFSVTTFVDNYLGFALWMEAGDDPRLNRVDESDMSHDDLGRIVADCARFVLDHHSMIRRSMKSAAQHFYLSRNGHDTGFCRNKWGDDTGETLDAAARLYGPQTLCIGDDGLLKVSCGSEQPA